MYRTKSPFVKVSSDRARGPCAKLTGMNEQSTSSSWLLRGTAAAGTLQIVGLEGTALVETIRRQHLSSKTATAALGRSAMGAVLLADVLNKNAGARVTVRVQGGGPIGWIVAEGGKGEGEAPATVRAYARESAADLAPRQSDGKLDVGGLVGQEGELAVTRLLENGEPWTGSVPLVSGEIAEDISAYLGHSEQIPNALLLGVYEEGAQVSRAGGLLVRAMPGVDDATLMRLEANVRGLGQLTDAMKEGGILGALQRVGAGLDLQLAPAAEGVEVRCRCSTESALDALRFFDQNEHAEMIAEGGQEVLCHWCNTAYWINPEQIATLLDEA